MTESAQKKRKWDLDDQGQTRPEGTATKITKVDDEFPSKTPSSDQGEAAMNEAAAKINAILAQKGIVKKEPTVPAIGESQQPKEGGQQQQSDQQHLQKQKPHPPPREKLENEFVKNIPINDLKNRYMLTRGATQAQIQRDTGADVTTRGKYYPDKALATDGEPPLYLYVSASSQESLDKAVAQIEDLIANAAVPTVVPPHRQDNHHPHHQQERPPRKFHEEKIYVGLESTPHFNLRAKIVGPHGAYVKHIQNETGSRVQLKGKGSGFYETTTGQEAEDALHVHITCTREDGLEKAVQLTKDLLNTVKADYERGPPPKQYGGYYGGRGGYRGGYHGGHHHHHHGGYGYQGGYQPTPPPPPQHLSPQAQPQSSSSPSSGTPTSGADDSQPQLSPQSQTPGQPQSQSATATSSGFEGGDKNAAPSYNGYDYSQYYAYYGQYQYDPSYYNYYGYSNAPSAAISEPPATSPPPPPPLPPSDASSGSPYQQQSQQGAPPPPPPPEDPKSQSYNAVPPPPPPPQE